MKKTPILITTLVVVIVSSFYIWTALLARKKSDDIMSKFKETEESFRKSEASGQDTHDGIGAVDKIYPAALLKSEIIQLIDSLKENLDSSSRPIHNSKQLEGNFKILLRNIQTFNRLRWRMADSKIPDTITYWPSSDKFSEEDWIKTFVRGQPVVAIQTYLTYVKNQLLSVN
jgi:hypothetical protein